MQKVAGMGRGAGKGRVPGSTTELTITAHWEVVKWPDGIKKPRTDRVSRALKWAFPWRENVPAEIIRGGDDIPTTIEYPERPPFWEFCKQHYPRILRVIRSIRYLWRKLWH